MTLESVRAKWLQKIDALAGTPFEHLPGWPAQDILLAEIDGRKVLVENVEKLMNDAWTIDTLNGQGAYINSCRSGSFQDKVYALAVKLYGCEPIHLHGGRVGPEVVN